MPSPTFHFISGLPRAGSTLLSALLLQNPRFHAGISSPIGALFSGMLNQLGAGSEIASQVNMAQRKRLLRGLFDAYYAEQMDKSVIFDTNRMWSAKLPALLDQFPNAKVIACVRSVAWVMDSLERLYRANPYENTKLFNDDSERNTVFARVDTLSQRNRLVGFAWSSLKEAYYGEHSERLLLVDYDTLARAPLDVLQQIYSFLGEPAFKHSTTGLRYDTPEFDQALGISGLHKVREKVSLQQRNTVLPPDLFAQYNALSFWLNRDGTDSKLVMQK